MGLILILVVIGVVVLLVLQRSDTGRGIASTGTTSVAQVNEKPLEILNKRYARGEIERTQYEERKRDLV